MALGYACYAADRTVLSSVLAPLSASLSLNNAEIGFLGSAQYIGVGCIVFLSGHISDRYGRWPVIVSGLAVFTAFTWLVGVASNFDEAFAFRFLSGLGEGAFWPVAMAAVATHFRERKGLALGVFYVGFDVGSVMGLTLGGLAYSFYDSWRPSFFIAPLVGLPVLGAAILGWRRLGRLGQGASGMRLGRDALLLVKKKQVLVVMAFALLATWASVFQVVFLPYYFFKVLKTSVLSAALLSSIVTVAGAFGKVILGGASDRWRRDRLLVLCSLAALGSYLLFFSASQFYLDMVGAISMGFFSASIFPIMQALMADRCQGETGTALGLTTTSQSIGTIIAPITTAPLFVFGVGRGAAIGAMVPAALAVLLALLLREPRNQ
jgi:MFS transporter, ACS family, aldohexuronate transporter